jgi:succinate dehydrogenase/fumarate reductase iron-sulfur protein
MDSEPEYRSYEVPWKEYLTALQALHYINDYIEPIAFDYSCRGGLCGRCGIMIDGKPVLSCYTVLKEEQTYVFDPLEGMPVMRDLVVDRTEVADTLMNANAEVESDGELDPFALPEHEYEFWWEDLHRKNMCRECGLCYVVCPLYRADKASYAGPATLSQVYLRAFDKVDKTDRIQQAVDLGVFNCILCGRCNEVCPSFIDHVDCNRTLQAAAAERGLAPAAPPVSAAGQ